MVEYKIIVPPVNLWNFSRLKFWKKNIMTLDELVGRMVQLEHDFLELKKEHEELLEAYKKDVDEAYRTGYRNGLESQNDSRCSNQGH